MAAGELGFSTNTFELFVGTAAAGNKQIGGRVPVVLPFYIAAGTSNPVSLNSESELPFFVAAGTANNIPMTT